MNKSKPNLELELDQLVFSLRFGFEDWASVCYHIYKQKKLYSTIQLQHCMLKGIKGHIGKLGAAKLASKPWKVVWILSLPYLRIPNLT